MTRLRFIAPLVALATLAAVTACSGDGVTPPSDACPDPGLSSNGYGEPDGSGDRVYSDAEEQNFSAGCLTRPAAAVAPTGAAGGPTQER